MKIKNLLLSLIVVNAGVIGGFTYVTSVNLENNNAYVTKAAKEGVVYQNLNDTSRLAQVNFQRQVQEWKNILIRGNDEEQYKKYLDGFEKKEKSVQEGLVKAKEILAKNNISGISEDIDKLLADHKELGVKYREALTTFDAADPETGKKVDVLLRGIDRPASSGMDKVSDKIKALAEKELTGLSETVDAKNKESVQYLMLASLFLFSLLTAVFFILRQYIMKLLGGEPSELNAYFQELSQGNFKYNLNVEKNDKVSVAFNSKMMHFKLRNMIKTIQNMTNDIEGQINSSKLGDSANSILETLRNTKKEVRGLSETVEKFDV